MGKIGKKREVIKSSDLSVRSKRVKKVGSPNYKKSPKPLTTQTNTINTWLSKEDSHIDTNSDSSPKLRSKCKKLREVEYSTDAGRFILQMGNEDELPLTNKIEHIDKDNSKKKWKNLVALGQLSKITTEHESVGQRKHISEAHTEEHKENVNTSKCSKRQRHSDKKCKNTMSDDNQEEINNLNTTPTKKNVTDWHISPRRSPRSNKTAFGNNGGISLQEQDKSKNSIPAGTKDSNGDVSPRDSQKDISSTTELKKTKRKLYTESVTDIEHNTKHQCNLIEIFNQEKKSTNSEEHMKKKKKTKDELFQKEKKLAKQSKTTGLITTLTKQNYMERSPLRNSPKSSKSLKHSSKPKSISNTSTALKKARQKLSSKQSKDKTDNFKKKSENTKTQVLQKGRKTDLPLDKAESKNKLDNQKKYVDNSGKTKKESGSDGHNERCKKQIAKKYTEIDIFKGFLDTQIRSSKKQNRSKSIEKGSSKLHGRQEKLDSFVIKKQKASQKTEFCRTESSESYDLPSFEKSKKSKECKSEEFTKYGTTLPSIEEILKEQKDLATYRNQIEAFEDIEHQPLDISFSIKDLNKTPEYCGDILGCKHLSVEEITDCFKKNLSYVSDIFHGKKYSERHERFFNNKYKSCRLTVKDLTYSTSMIVFSYDQIEHILKLLKEEFDPEDKWTPYFFQVLLPEFCLKVFMDIHEMTNEEAVKYLDTRPIV